MKINLHLHDFENLGDKIDYSDRFVTDRKFDSVDKLHAWADKIAIGIGFQFTCASYKQKGRSRVNLYLRCHRYGNIRGDLYNLDNAARPGSKSRTCRERTWTVRVCPDEKERHNHPFLVYREGHIRANRLIVDIRQYIRELSATGMQPAFIMTSIR